MPLRRGQDSRSGDGMPLTETQATGFLIVFAAEAATCPGPNNGPSRLVSFSLFTVVFCLSSLALRRSGPNIASANAAQARLQGKSRSGWAPGTRPQRVPEVGYVCTQHDCP